MKIRLIYLLIAAALSSCNTITTKVTAPDGTVTETTARTTDSASIQAGVALAGAFAPREIERRGK